MTHADYHNLVLAAAPSATCCQTSCHRSVRLGLGPDLSRQGRIEVAPELCEHYRAFRLGGMYDLDVLEERQALSALEMLCKDVLEPNKVTSRLSAS